MQRAPSPTDLPPSSEPESRGRHLAVVPSLSDAERRRREEAVRFANASVGLEGFKVSAQAQARADRFIAGEIDLAEFLQGK